MCMACFSHFKQRDGAMYKKQIIRSVEVLFEKATTRAFTKISTVIVQWLFGIWQTQVRQNKQRRLQAMRILQQSSLRRCFTTWHEFIYKRRIVGAMLFAESQQQVTRERNTQIATLHGDVFEITSNAQVQRDVHCDDMAKLQQVCTTQQQQFVQKNQELLALRKELQSVHERIAVLEKQVIDPKELERIKAESGDYKKIAFQLVTTVFQHMETQVEQLATSEGRQNLANVFTKEIVQSLDKPECQAFYNPLVELESAPMTSAASAASAAAAQANNGMTTTQAESSSSIPTSNGATGSSFFTSYDASTDRAEKILMQWVNTLMQKHGPEWLPTLAPPRMLNFHSSLNDGKIFVVLTKVLHQAMCKVRPKRPPGAVSSKLEAASVLRENGKDLTEIAMERYLEHMKKEESPEKRVELMISTIGQAMWLPVGMLNTKDILAGDAEFNFASLSYLFATFSPCLDDAFYTMCNDFKLQLSSAKTKWRELREGAVITTVPPSTALNMSGNSGASTLSATNSEDSTLSSRMKLALAQTLDLKRKFDVEDQKARESNLLWWKSVRIVMRKCFLSYARLARGKAGALTRLDANSDENEAFSKVPKHKLQDLELPFEDFAWEMKLLQSYLLTIYCDLARIYRGYATRNGIVNETISLGDFIELLGDCRVLDAAFMTNDVHNIIKKMDPKQTNLSAHRVMAPLDFLEALIRVARKKYTAEHHRITLSEAFCLFTDNFIFPFAFRADADLFRKQVEEPKIRRLLIKYADELKELYSKYAVEDPKKKGATRKRPRMTAFTFSQCLLDKGIQDVAFNNEKVLALLQKVVRTKHVHDRSSSSNGSTIMTANSSIGSVTMSALTGSSVNSMGASEDDELAYKEFEEAMIAIACHKFPDPYISLESRVEKFLALYVRSLRSESMSDSGK
uniref:Calponin-homology (CH) domain-containing protein n=1 Tax=Globisporangium ultimum (strain ATCC 200006 / CBS 805.95 / DAOM BR144) TaxID=431595 RepID=K3WP77_GLOUD